jgi:transposase
MHRQKGTPNTPAAIIEEIIRKHMGGVSIRELAEEYSKPYKTIKSMVSRENRKKRRREESGAPPKQRGRKAAVSLQEYKYENKRLKMENELLRDFLHLAGRR